ncbi:MAG: hypothetical protein M1151_03800 [Candidatus Thermoplasmatota archaeon]|jgi:hypothetical protein|nr:hypothetical protein [Candidatus Thermoplasmatota archaeon]
MKGVAVIFRLPENTDLNTMNKFTRGLYGQDSTSWKGRYKHHRHGILEDIPHRKFLRGVLFLNKNDAERVVEYLREFSADFYIGSLELTPDDEKILRRAHE